MGPLSLVDSVVGINKFFSEKAAQEFQGFSTICPLVDIAGAVAQTAYDSGVRPYISLASTLAPLEKNSLRMSLRRILGPLINSFTASSNPFFEAQRSAER